MKINYVIQNKVRTILNEKAREQAERDEINLYIDECYRAGLCPNCGSDDLLIKYPTIFWRGWKFCKSCRYKTEVFISQNGGLP